MTMGDCKLLTIRIFIFFSSLYAFPPKGDLGCGAAYNTYFRKFFLSLQYAFPPEEALGYEALEKFWDLARMTVTTATRLAKALARFRDINDRDKKMLC